MVSFKSSHPLSQKIGAAYGLINRAMKLTSESHKGEVKKLLKDILRKNDYPKTLINRLMNRQETSLSQRRVSEDQPTSFRAMTYVRGLSEKLGKIIRDGNPTIHKLPSNQ